MINHKQILSNLNSYKKLYELTKAIQLVALSKLRTLKKKELNRLLYPSYIFLSNNNKLKNNTKINNLIIPITTDKSCCGSINNNIIEKVKYYSQILKSTYYIFLIGKKGLNLSKKLYTAELIYNIFEITKINLSIITLTILIEKLEVYNKNLNLSNYIFIFNYFKNIVTQKIATIKLYSKNFFINYFFNKLNNVYLNNIITNKHKSFINDLYDYMIYIIIIKVLYENEISEYGARASSMRNASKNAEELIDKLQLQYNKARQSHITNELIEIISCVNSIIIGNNLDKYSFYLQFIHE